MEATFFYIGLYLLVSLLHLASSRVDTYSGWNTSPDTQYHIQTDEGEERYFKYQTRSGQYRKEKRLQDGTVVGTYGWVDPNGFLRLRDYIADNDGYRILKSKMIFVGSNAISDTGSVSPVKSYPTKYATLNTNPYQLPFETKPHRFSNTYLPPSPSTYLPPAYQSYVLADYRSTTPASTLRLSTLTTTPADVAPIIHYYPSSTPVVDILPNSIPKFSTPIYIKSTPAPSVAVFQEDHTPKPVAVYSSTPKPVAVNYVSTPSSSPSYSSTPRPTIGYSSTPSSIEHTTSRPSISAIGYTASTPSPEPLLPPISGKFASSNNFITETEKNKLFFQHQKNNYYKKRYVDYQTNDQQYDGVSATHNGFKYFLPRQYHEEQSSSDGSHRQGSFGYVDPFGIRRVIYYNTSPDRGFVHRKNNRYVGFNSTPYDPRP